MGYPHWRQKKKILRYTKVFFQFSNISTATRPAGQFGCLPCRVESAVGASGVGTGPGGGGVGGAVVGGAGVVDNSKWITISAFIASDVIVWECIIWI